MLQDFRIGNLLSIEADAASGFKLTKLADAPPCNPKGSGMNIDIF
jgi:hypothetical protein